MSQQQSPIHSSVSSRYHDPITRFSSRSCIAPEGLRAFRMSSILLALCIVAIAMIVLPAPVAAAQPDLQVTFVVPNFGGAAAGTVFSREPNSLRITVKNNGDGSSPESVMRILSNDGLNVDVTVTSIAAGGTTYVAAQDTVYRSTSGGTVTYTITIDPNNLIAESNETNNVYTRTMPDPVAWNGYKGKAIYRDGGTNITTSRTYDLEGGLVHSFGNSYYRSGSYGGSWTQYDVTWNGTQPVVPVAGTIREARLYLPYTWDNSYLMPLNVTVKFNGNDITSGYQTWEWDRGNFGEWGPFTYGLLTYDVTSLYQKNGINYVNFTRPGANDKLSLYGMTLLVVYENSAESRKQIFLNEGFDLLGADPVAYATNESEAIGYIEFSGLTISPSTAEHVNLISFVPSADSWEGNLYVNGQLVATNVWNYGASGQPVGEDGLPQVAVDVRDIKAYLNPTGNVVGIQSNAWASQPCMAAAQQFLVVDFGPVALPGLTNRPTDPDGDGLYEDLNGNGAKDLNDVVRYFKNIVWMIQNEPVACFDFNGNGNLDLNDVVRLFKEMTP